MGLSFKADISKWAGRSLEEVEDTRRDVAEQFFVGTVKDTPVDTGALKANWTPSKETPKFETRADTDKNGQATISKIRSMLATGSKHKDQTVYLTNSLPYANKAENTGWRITPAYGMVKKNFTKVVNMIKARSLG